MLTEEKSQQGGPRELAEMVIAARQPPPVQTPNGQPMPPDPRLDQNLGDITEEGLMELLTLVYKVSFEKEEGRYPRFSICVLPYLDEELAYTVRFSPIFELDLSSLHRLAPAIPPYPMVLAVKCEGERKDRFLCKGIFRHAWDSVEVGGGHLPQFGRGAIVRLIIRVNGPGSLSVSECKDYELC